MSSQVQMAPQRTQTAGLGPFNARPAPLLAVLAMATLLSHLDHIHARERLVTTALPATAAVSLDVAQKMPAVR